MVYCIDHVFQDIRKLFPSEYNPFYAGFGNRDTDELSYRKMGIPKGKIFIINPKVFFFISYFSLFSNFFVNWNAGIYWQGEVATSHRVDVKSYTSLHTLVNDMFPPTSLVEQVWFVTLELERGGKWVGIQKTNGHVWLWFWILTLYMTTGFIWYSCRKISTHGIFGKCHCRILICRSNKIQWLGVLDERWIY